MIVGIKKDKNTSLIGQDLNYAARREEILRLILVHINLWQRERICTVSYVIILNSRY